MFRFATIGTSWITTQFAADAARVDGVEVACAYSRDAARAAAFAERIGAPESTSDLAGLLASDDVDAVYVASPNALHLEQALAVIRAGKHVLVEKPATTTAADFATSLPRREPQASWSLRGCVAPTTRAPTASAA